MEYTEDQYSILSKMSGGLYVDWWETSSEEWAIIEFLESEGLCSVAGDRDFGTWTLTQRGKQVLEFHKKQCDQDAAKYAEKRADKLQLRKDQIQERRDKWFIALVSCLLSAVLTLCVEHFHEIVLFLSGLFH